jgi:3',5'-cyclic AMP phosphodiesterase CpdA
MKSGVYFYIIAALILIQSLASGQEIAFMSDIQNPIWVETLKLRPFRNSEATDTLFSDIISRRPKALFLLGDIVSIGSDINLWEDVDDNLKQMRNERIPVYAVPGNHEYMFVSSFGILNFTQRFPYLPDNGFFRIVDSIAIIMLNSNFGYLSPMDYQFQLDYYHRIMKELDTASSVKFIVVACHHSPFTNSTIVDPSADVRKQFVPLFEKTKKAKLFLSGHSHNLEYFINMDKNYLVIGGGGGLKQPLYEKGYRKYSDEIENNFKPVYFYILLKRKGNDLTITSRGLNRDFILFDSHITTIHAD